MISESQTLQARLAVVVCDDANDDQRRQFALSRMMLTLRNSTGSLCPAKPK